ncbi:HNH endonuclease [Anaerolineales bacterium HSG25]|nr:HNH endonuclease [Anaerolineales bacterium HSG25]
MTQTYLVIQALKNLGGTAHLNQIFEEVCTIKPDWSTAKDRKAIIRRIVQLSPKVYPIRPGSGIWRLVETAREVNQIPEEITSHERHYEGAVERISVNRYERSTKAKSKCLEYYGATCAVCQLDFNDLYGEAGRGLIHVHHLTALSEVQHEYEVDPIQDLRPVCPNCHAMLHRKNPPYTIEEIREFLETTTAGRLYLKLLNAT